MQHRYDEYLRVEAASPTKHEYCEGELFAMAGGTPEHAALAAEVLAALRAQLPRAGHVMTADVRVRIEATDLSTYPDGAVVCGGVRRSALDPHAITNPMLLLEVTSPSSEGYDRGEKLRTYQQLASLAAVLLVSHRERRVTLVERVEGEWRTQELREGSVARCAAPAFELAVDALYEALVGL